jgi:hypothetical protein
MALPWNAVPSEKKTEEVPPAVEDFTPGEPTPWTGIYNAKDLPVGSELSNPGTNWKLKKIGDSVWENPTTGVGFNNEEIDDQKGEGFEMTVPSADAPSGDGLVEGPWKDTNVSAVGLPAGSSISMDNNDYVITKQTDGSWTANTGTKFESEHVDNLKTATTSNWTFKPAEGSESTSAAEPEPSTPNIPEDGQFWADTDADAKDLPIGSTLTYGSTTVTKTGEHEWTSGSGAKNTNGFVNGLKGDGWEYTSQPKEQAGSEEDAPVDFNNTVGHPKDLPIGTVLTSKSTGKKIEKTGHNVWTHENGNQYGDANMASVQDGTFTIKKPADWDADAGGFKPTVAWDQDNDAKAADMPIGSKVHKDNGSYWAVKVANNSWESSTHQHFTDDTVDMTKAVNKYSMDEAIPADMPAPTGPAVSNLGEPSSKLTGAQTSDFEALAEGTTIVDPASGYMLKKMKLAADGPLRWVPVDISGNPVQFKDGTSYALMMELEKGSKHFPDGDWNVYAPGTAPQAPQAPGATKLSDASANDFKALPEGTVVIDTGSGYMLKKQLDGNGMTEWIPLDAASGNEIKFKDGENYATNNELATDGDYFEDAVWDVFAPGAHKYNGGNATAASQAAGPGQGTPTKLAKPTSNDMDDLVNGTVIVEPETGYTLVKEQGHKWFPKDAYDNKIKFKDGEAFATNFEVSSESIHFDDDLTWDVYAPGTYKYPGSAPAPDSSGVATKLANSTYDDMNDLPSGTVIVDPETGYTMKKSDIGEWIPKAKDTGEDIKFKDGDYYATSGEISNEGSYFPTTTWDVYAPSTHKFNGGSADPSANAPAATAAPTGPATGPVGSPTNPAVVAGKKLTLEDLESYPTGTTLKKETSYSVPSQYYYVKKADGTWDMMKNKGNKVHMNYSSSSLKNSTFGAQSTATVNQPKPYGKHAVVGSGEIVYPGSPVFYKSSVSAPAVAGTVKSITNAGKLVIQLLDGTQGPKANSKLTGGPGYGLKGTATATPSPSTSPAPSVSSQSIPQASTPSASNVTPESFAGASAEEYNANGVTVGSVMTPPKVGVVAAEELTGEDLTNNPLHGATAPKTPEAPDLGKWDSAAWLKKVEERYAANPNKAKDTVQQSNNWNAVQNVLDGQAGSLDSLLEKKYIDQDMYDEATAGMKAFEEANKETLAKHQAEMDQFAKDFADWKAANPSTNNWVAPTMPEVSTESFTGGEADWSKAHAGTYTANDAIAAVKQNTANAKFGIYVATDSAQLEDLTVKFNRVLDTSGEEKLELRFKLTSPFGKEFAKKLEQNGTTSTGQVYFPNYAYDEGSDLMKDTATSYSTAVSYTSGKRFSWTDPDTGATVVFNRTSNPDAFAQHTLNNSVRVLMPTGSTSADYQKLLENMGIVAKPASEGDIMVFGENKMISVLTGNHDVRVNSTGAARAAALKGIKDKFGITPEDLSFAVDAHGQPKFKLSDKAVSALQSYTNVSAFKHNIMIDHASGDSHVDRLFAMMSGPNPAIISTYNRWHHGIHKGGMSSSSDINSGSGDYVYTKPVHGPVSASGFSIGIDAKKALARLDVYGNQSDKGDGERGANAGKVHDLMKGNPYEIMFRNHIPISDWTHVSVSSAAAKKELVDRLTEKGILQINGIPLNQFIITSGSTPPVLPEII